MRRAGALAAAWLVATLVGAPAAARPVDAILAEVAGVPVAASDIALARALGLFGFEPDGTPIDAVAVRRYVDARLVVRAATELAIAGTPEEREAAWQAAAERLGGATALAAWLDRVAIDAAWARQLIEEDLRWRRFVALRFRALAFVSETEVATQLGPGDHADAEHDRARETLRAAALRRQLDEWLEDARRRTTIRLVLDAADTAPVPFPMPPARNGG